jgi:hypothetical protein
MKSFLKQHLFPPYTITIFDEDKPPEYFLSKDFKWWYDDYVLKLEVDESISTDFNRVTRIS